MTTPAKKLTDEERFAIAGGILQKLPFLYVAYSAYEDRGKEYLEVIAQTEACEYMSFSPKVPMPYHQAEDPAILAALGEDIIKNESFEREDFTGAGYDDGSEFDYPESEPLMLMRRFAAEYEEATGESPFYDGELDEYLETDDEDWEEED
jgi:hypothetical protein